MILGSSTYGSLGIRLRSGTTVFINLTNQTGGLVLKGAARILKALRDAGVTEKTEPEVIRSMGFETVRHS